MLRIEKIFKKEEIEEEIGAYQALIPDGTNFKATMLIKSWKWDGEENAWPA